ncbi:3-oxoacyl-[acyl-carrier-protein] reductase FabG isoform X3 [Syngnathus typhle]|uniref:3-oxoacyl-[acyl-carrier-protein] reductase FabG isoform X3 n=1 Tax=Syngnathus typhle TaxID=161592 RepID=UPI002A6A82E7|nr:3-oxoacyl-[acyl-carrier-protein] reductase FabG isoform X3 [Syngnathus typhle]
MASDDAYKVSSLKGKVSLITGASSGIGAGTAVLFAKLGAVLALNGRNVESLKKVAKECAECGGGTEPLLLPGDLTDEDAVKRTVEDVMARFGRLDVLVNSAGILAMGGIETSDLATYDRVMNINVRSVYQLTQLCVPHLVKTKGSIVNVSSVNGQRSNWRRSKFESTRCEVHKRAGLDEEQYAKFLEKCKQTHALGRPGEVDEVAHSIAFLASDAATFITGVNLPIDGGRHAMCPR